MAAGLRIDFFIALYTAKTPITNGSGVPASDSVRCNEQFILRNGTCQPTCDRWKVISVALADSTFVLTIILATAAGVFGVILLIISLKSRKKMYVITINAW